jgi:anti-sigma factor RsiW
MQCPEFEIRLCDYLDGTLDRALRQELEQHASGCAACAALLEDSQAVTAFFERTPVVEAPPNLAAQILYRTQAARTAAERAREDWRRWFQPLLAPRLVMGMAMTILSISMFARVANVQIRQLQPADLSPAAVWANVSGRVQRAWNHGVEVYENIKLFYEVAMQLRAAEAEAEDATAAGGDPRRIEPANRPEPKR